MDKNQRNTIFDKFLIRTLAFLIKIIYFLTRNSYNFFRYNCNNKNNFIYPNLS